MTAGPEKCHTFPGPLFCGVPFEILKGRGYRHGRGFYGRITDRLFLNQIFPKSGLGEQIMIARKDIRTFKDTYRILLRQQDFVYILPHPALGTWISNYNLPLFITAPGISTVFLKATWG